MYIIFVCVRMYVKSLWSCPPIDCSPPGSSVQGILQARTLGSAVTVFSRKELGGTN